MKLNLNIGNFSVALGIRDDQTAAAVVVTLILIICAFLAGYWAGRTGSELAPSEIVLHELGVVQVAYGQTSANTPNIPPGPQPVRAPYIYIHGPYGSKVSVNVTFTNGSPTMVVPEATITENSISWENVTVIDNNLLYQGKSFPRLFYEGELLYGNPLRIEITSPDNYENHVTFKVVNLGDLTLKHIYIFCNPYTLGGYTNLFVYFEELGPQEQVERTIPILVYVLPPRHDLENRLAQTMVNEGIYENEARDFLCGWVDYWVNFAIGPSARAVYRIPSPVIDEILRLDIQVPSGTELTSERILWALIENITPS
jgi:hypothetical protein